MPNDWERHEPPLEKDGPPVMLTGRFVDREPLHVQVARALGCTPRHIAADESIQRPDGFYCNCEGQCPLQWVPPVGTVAGGLIDRYDTDWAATGPLIERLRIMLAWNPRRSTFFAAHGCDDDVAPASVEVIVSNPAEGATPLLAVCGLLLKLHAAGELDALLAAP